MCLLACFLSGKVAAIRKEAGNVAFYQGRLLQLRKWLGSQVPFGNGGSNYGRDWEARSLSRMLVAICGMLGSLLPVRDNKSNCEGGCAARLLSATRKQIREQAGKPACYQGLCRNLGRLSEARCASRTVAAIREEIWRPVTYQERCQRLEKTRKSIPYPQNGPSVMMAGTTSETDISTAFLSNMCTARLEMFASPSRSKILMPQQRQNI